jgi:hypothetical protein
MKEYGNGQPESYGLEYKENDSKRAGDRCSISYPIDTEMYNYIFG